MAPHDPCNTTPHRQGRRERSDASDTVIGESEASPDRIFPSQPGASQQQPQRHQQRSFPRGERNPSWQNQHHHHRHPPQLSLDRLPNQSWRQQLHLPPQMQQQQQKCPRPPVSMPNQLWQERLRLAYTEAAAQTAAAAATSASEPALEAVTSAPPPPASRGGALGPPSSNDDGHGWNKGAATVRIDMKNWIPAALHSLGKPAGCEGGISSGAYLTRALQIAHSLAHQLCDSEKPEGGASGGSGGSSQGRPRPPERGLRWSDMVTIHIRCKADGSGSDDCERDVAKRGAEDERNNDRAGGNFYPKFHSIRGGSPSSNPQSKLLSGNGLPWDPFSESCSGGNQGIQGGTVNPLDGSIRFNGSIFENLTGTEARRDRPINFLNVSDAELLTENEPETNASPSRRQGERMRIYNLGLVFFELFSGGERPPAASEDELGADPLLDHLSVAAPPPLTSIIDAIGDEDELFGGAGMEGSEHSAPGEAAQRKVTRAPEELSALVEPLRSLGLPVALCDLIGNMICSGGDFSGNDEAYSCIADVVEDLQLMRELPQVYLRDLDLKDACEAGLQMEAWYGREGEFASLEQSYQRSVSHRFEAAIICGQAGVGKTKLASEFIQHIKTEGREKVVVLRGKFDNLQQSHPFSPIASAFNGYCKWLLSIDEDGSISKRVSNALKRALGQEVYVLAKAIPNLYEIIGNDAGPPKIDGIVDPQKMLTYLLSQFAEVISRSHDAPLVLFLDNLEFADKASIAHIRQILLGSGTSHRRPDSGSRRHFFLGCWGELTSGRDHPLWTMLRSVSSWVKTMTIELDCFGREVVNSMISRRLLLLPRLVRPLADAVHRKTKGNPLFVRQLMSELSKEQLLRPSLSQRRWTWDIDRIRERQLPDDVVSFLTASLHRLPGEVLSALCTLSCFGSSSDRSLFELERELGATISGNLDRAVAESLLDKRGTKYVFVHDRLKEAAYNMMKPEERFLNHYKYGLALCSVAERNSDDGLFLIAVGQINLGGPISVADKEGRLRAACRNLSAGKKAMAMSDFTSAYWFMDFGISYLKNGHWENHYELALELFNRAADCAFHIGKHDSLTALSQEIILSAKCFEDKLNIFYTTFKLLVFRSQLPAAIDCGMDALSNLGYNFPEQVTPMVMTSLLEDTKEMLDGMCVDDLINHKIMMDPKTIWAMKFWAKLSEALYMVRPRDQPVAVLTMIQLSMMHGMSLVSPLAFASYGHFLACNGRIREGACHARVARALLDKVGSREVSGEVIAYATSLMAYVEPVQSAIEAHIDGQRAAMRCGAWGYAFLNAFLYDSCCFWSGKKLGLVKRQLDQTVSLIKQHKHVVMWAQVLPLYESIAKIGLTSSRPSNPDAEFDCMFDAEKAASNIRAKSPFQSKPYHFNKMYAAFMFRNYKEMRIALGHYSESNIGTCIVVFSSSIQTFYEGLVSFWIGREEGDDSWIAKGKQCLRAMENYFKECRWNFENKMQLLQAELQFCKGNFELAEVLYDASVYSARMHRFVNEEALANDLAGIFYLQRGKTREAKICFTHALEKYHEWEAYGKEKFLERKLRDM